MLLGSVNAVSRERFFGLGYGSYVLGAHTRRRLAVVAWDTRRTDVVVGTLRGEASGTWGLGNRP